MAELRLIELPAVTRGDIAVVPAHPARQVEQRPGGVEEDDFDHGSAKSQVPGAKWFPAGLERVAMTVGIAYGARAPGSRILALGTFSSLRLRVSAFSLLPTNGR